MITYTEKERRWILSDPGDISLRTGGKLEPSITSSMFIESPSSLELMLGRQKQPSWDCKDQNHNVLHSRNHPDQTRKRKASWSGEFEDQKSNPLQRGRDGVQSIGYSSISKKIRNFHVQYEDRGKVMVETLQMQRSIFPEYRRGTNGFHPVNKLKTSFGDVDIGNTTQHLGRQPKALTKVPKFRTSLSNPKLKKKERKLKDSKRGDRTQEDFSRNVQEMKVAPNLADLMSKGSGVEKKKLTMKGSRQYLPATVLANKTKNGVVLALPTVGCIGQDNLTLGNEGRQDLQVGISSKIWSKANSPLSTQSFEKRKMRIKIVGRHALGDGCLVDSMTGLKETGIVSQNVHHVEKLKKDQGVLGDECLASSSTGLKKNEVLSQGVIHAQQASKKRRQNQLLNDNDTLQETWERRIGSSKKINLQGLQIPGLVHTANQSQSDNGFMRRSPTDGHLACNEVLHFGSQGCALPFNRGDAHISIPNEVSTMNHIKDLENAHPEADEVRLRVKELLENFREIHNGFTGGHKDKEAFQIMVGFFPELLVNGTESIYGEVPGVEPGDRFHYRAEMDLVGLHHKPRKGIDFIPASKSRWPYGGKPVSVAACVVVAGGYVDNRDEGDVIIYTGEGGNNAIYDKGPSRDQMLTSGNEALRHSLLLHLYVRVVRKIDLKPPIKPYYRYDGLYAVKDMKKERSRGQKGKALHFGEDGEKLKSSKCNKMSSSTLVYKFLLIRKSREEKYENANFENLWTFKPSSCPPRTLNVDQTGNPSSSVNIPNSSQPLQDI